MRICLFALALTLVMGCSHKNDEPLVPLNQLPVVTDVSAIFITDSSSSVRYTISDSGSSRLIRTGLRAWTAGSGDTLVVEGDVALGTDTMQLPRLASATHYGVQAFATTHAGTTYSPIASFTTDTLPNLDPNTSDLIIDCDSIKYSVLTRYWPPAGGHPSYNERTGCNFRIVGQFYVADSRIVVSEYGYVIDTVPALPAPASGSAIHWGYALDFDPRAPYTLRRDVPYYGLGILPWYDYSAIYGRLYLKTNYGIIYSEVKRFR